VGLDLRRSGRGHGLGVGAPMHGRREKWSSGINREVNVKLGEGRRECVLRAIILYLYFLCFSSIFKILNID